MAAAGDGPGGGRTRPRRGGIWARAKGWVGGQDGDPRLRELAAAAVARARGGGASPAPGDLEGLIEGEGADARELRRLARALDRLERQGAAREAELRRSLAAKEALLREVHHRVKNNLQTVTSLLNLHARRAPSAEARAALTQANLRVRVLFAAHEGAFAEDDPDRLDLHRLLHRLGDLVEDAYAGRGGAVDLEVHADPARVSIDQAVPLALFAVEALGNAYSHAFDPGGAGRVRLAFERRAHRQGPRGVLEVADDGLGSWPDPPPGEGAALAEGAAGGQGLTLMRMFARQLRGELEIGRTPAGARCRLAFPLSPSRAAPHGTEGPRGLAAGGAGAQVVGQAPKPRNLEPRETLAKG